MEDILTEVEAILFIKSTDNNDKFMKKISTLKPRCRLYNNHKLLPTLYIRDCTTKGSLILQDQDFYSNILVVNSDVKIPNIWPEFIDYSYFVKLINK
jgi:hypothetical protein